MANAPRVVSIKRAGGRPLAPYIELRGKGITPAVPLVTSDEAVIAAARAHPLLVVRSLGEGEPAPSTAPYPAGWGGGYFDACGFRYGPAEFNSRVGTLVTDDGRPDYPPGARRCLELSDGEVAAPPPFLGQRDWKVPTVLGVWCRIVQAPDTDGQFLPLVERVYTSGGNPGADAWVAVQWGIAGSGQRRSVVVAEQVYYGSDLVSSRSVSAPFDWSAGWFPLRCAIPVFAGGEVRANAFVAAGEGAQRVQSPPLVPSGDGYAYRILYNTSLRSGPGLTVRFADYVGCTIVDFFSPPRLWVEPYPLLAYRVPVSGRGDLAYEDRRETVTDAALGELHAATMLAEWQPRGVAQGEGIAQAVDEAPADDSDYMAAVNQVRYVPPGWQRPVVGWLPGLADARHYLPGFDKVPHAVLRFFADGEDREFASDKTMVFAQAGFASGGDGYIAAVWDYPGIDAQQVFRDHSRSPGTPDKRFDRGVSFMDTLPDEVPVSLHVLGASSDPADPFRVPAVWAVYGYLPR